MLMPCQCHSHKRFVKRPMDCGKGNFFHSHLYCIELKYMHMERAGDRYTLLFKITIYSKVTKYRLATSLPTVKIYNLLECVHS